MAIRFTKYVDITSGVAAGAAVPRRVFMGRIFTTNPLVPVKSFLEFTTAADVGLYFGTTSEEYKRAVAYFRFLSKQQKRAKVLSYARWADVAVAPLIYGARATQLLANYTPITDGAFLMSLGATANIINGLDFSAATSLADVATIIQTAIRAASGGTQWSAASVTYDMTRGSFNFVGGSAVADALSVGLAGAGTEIAALLGWTPNNPGVVGAAIWSDGSLIETLTETLTLSAEASDNFGSLLFMPALTDDQTVEVATWTQLQNVKFIYSAMVLPINADDYAAAVALIGATSLTYAGPSGEFPEQLPMSIFAATDYTARNGTQNYMYQQDILTPSVASTTLSDHLDSIRVNYYGVTQTAGKNLAFYQRGYLSGVATDPKDWNVFANEIWLKDAAGVAIMRYLLALPKISANARGRVQILGALQPVIDEGLLNGTISVGKPLSPEQKEYIETVTGQDDAWYQVQNSGYWLNCFMQEIVVNDSKEWQGVYLLVYSKDDVVRAVKGTHSLI